MPLPQDNGLLIPGLRPGRSLPEPQLRCPPCDIDSHQEGSKGSAIPMEEQLEQVGATDIACAGDRFGPPDLMIICSGQRIAIRVARSIHVE